jgi:hypothetical protein
VEFLLRLIDPLRPTNDRAPEAYRFAPDPRVWAIPIGLGVALLAMTLVLGMAGAEEGHLFSKQFYFSYLIGWVFCVSISLGGLFFVIVQHLTNADWSIVVRRIPEMLMMNFPILIIFGLPVILGMHDLYHWTHEDLFDVNSDHFDALLAGKRGYLNTPFFIARLAVYFGLWTYLSFRLYKLSISQDVDPLPGRGRMADERKVSAWGLLVFALTTGFASFDLLMSLDPHWFSTMFGVYFFSGSFFVVLAAISMMALMLQRGGNLNGVITMEHYHDLGKFMFGFTVFWAYIAFSQYMLIWYANLPEETIWFRHRTEGGWGYVALMLLFGHFVFPFLVLAFRASKRNAVIMMAMAFWFLFIHFVDLYWIAMPVSNHHFELALIDITAWLGLTLFFAGLVVLRARRHATVPYNDPKFSASLAFENA